MSDYIPTRGLMAAYVAALAKGRTAPGDSGTTTWSDLTLNQRDLTVSGAHWAGSGTAQDPYRIHGTTSTPAYAYRSDAAFNLGSAARTLVVWHMRTQTIGDNVGIAGKMSNADYSVHTGWGIVVDGNTKLQPHQIENDGTGKALAPEASATYDTSLHCLISVYDGNTITLYEDGTSVATDTNATSFNADNDVVFAILGCGSGGQNTTKGYGDVAACYVYNVALTSDERSQIQTAGPAGTIPPWVPVTGGLVQHLNAAYATGSGPGSNSPPTTTWTDLSGSGHDGTMSNFAWTTSDGYATTPARVQFDGTTHRSSVDFLTSLLTGSTWTLEMWVHGWGTGGNLWGRGQPHDVDNYPWCGCGYDGSGYLYINTRSDSATDVWHPILLSALAADDHIVLTWNGTTATLYRNGASVGTHNFSPNFAQHTEANTYYGKHADSATMDYPWDGSMLCARIYSTVLSSTDILQNYWAGPTAIPSSTYVLEHSIGSGIGSGISSGIN
jgi:hypothetical protein